MSKICDEHAAKVCYSITPTASSGLATPAERRQMREWVQTLRAT